MPFHDCTGPLYLVRADGTRLTRVSADVRNWEWSPDGRRLAAFVYRDRGEHTDLLLVTPGRRWRPKVLSHVGFASWSPTAANIAFVRRLEGDEPAGRLFVARADGSRARRVGERVSGFDWSPDGTRLVFTEHPDARSGGFRVVVARRDGTEAQTIVEGSSGFPSPNWSPNGRWIAFQDAYGRFSTVRADGSNTTPLATRPCIGRMEWSPDGSMIAVACAVFIPPSGGYVPYVTRPETDTVTLRAHGWPLWSPTGRRIAFVRPEFDVRTIVLRDPGGGNAVALPPSSRAPAWSPRGARLAFTVGGAHAPRVHVVREDGTHLRRVAIGRSPSWSPDGRRLVFMRDMRPYVVDLASGRVRPLARMLRR